MKPKHTTTTIERDVAYHHIQTGGRRRVVESLTSTIRTDAGAVSILLELRYVQRSRRGKLVLVGPYWYAAIRDPGGARGRRRVVWAYLGREPDVGKAARRLASKVAGGSGRVV